MHFTKMQGAGNDFIIINNIREKIPYSAFPALAKKLCERRMSIGADGMMVVDECGEADFKMTFYNSDGSLGEMCGNGARCICRYGYEHGLSDEHQRLMATAGLVEGERISQELYRVRLNDPSVIDLERDAGGTVCAYIELGDPGIPHAVVIKEDFEAVPRAELFDTGRDLRFSPAFPKGANVTFVKSVGKDALRALTYERGVEDFTLACGTGCGSTVTALTLMGLVSGKNVSVSFPGGELFVSLTAEGGTVHDIFLTGPAVTVCEGETYI